MILNMIILILTHLKSLSSIHFISVKLRIFSKKLKITKKKTHKQRKRDALKIKLKDYQAKHFKLESLIYFLKTYITP